MPISIKERIGADIADYLNNVGFRFFRSDRVSFPDRDLTDDEVKLYKAFSELYPYLRKHLPDKYN